jgi:hypothetical protein
MRHEHRWFPPLKWCLRKALFLLVAFLALFALALIAFAWKCNSSAREFPALFSDAGAQTGPATDVGKNRRPLEDSYYSYPEWYIVWSYDERASYLERGSMPSEFPYFASIRQYWRGYCFIWGLTRSRHQFNFGDHLMLVVLGSSFALEYGIRGAYEQTIGRFSEWTSANQLVDEDAYAAKVAREYADFVYVRPFYEFHFAHALKQLWKETPLWGQHPLRKWERKAILSTDYGLEAIYAEILEKASHLTYGVELTETYAWIDNVPYTFFRKYPRIRKVKEVGPLSYIVSIPRYQEFTELAVKLAKDDVHFVQIAGNDVILVTAIIQQWNQETPEEQVLFFEPFLTRPSVERVALECRVRDLHLVLSDLAGRGIPVEHVYDY